MRTSLRRVWVSLSVIFLLFGLSGCDALMSQNAKDWFWNKRFPKQLEWIRSQMREIPLKKQEAIIARTAHDKRNPEILKVAVIDSGVDIAHEDLLKQISYTVEDGKITGAGHDIMGEGKFASHVLIDPSLFAFGAGEIRDGKIVNPPESPLALLKAINDRFRVALLAEIHNDPLLKDSLFNRLQPESFSIIGFKHMRQKSSMYLSDYKESAGKNELVNANTQTSDPLKQFAYNNIQNSWSHMTNEHRPDALDHLSNIEHADRFLEALNKAHEAVNRDVNFEGHLKNYEKFLEVLAGDKDSRLPSTNYPDGLKNAMEFALYGVNAYDPIWLLDREFASRPEYKGLSLKQAYDKFLTKHLAKIESVINDPKTDKKNVKILEKAIVDLKKFAGYFENLEELRRDPVAYNKMRSDLRRFVFHTQHPYIAKESADNEHGTHVAGVIAKQHPNIRIVPIRVTTQSVVASKSRLKEVTQEIFVQFQEFAKTPYFEPLKAIIAAEYGGLDMSNKNLEMHLQKYLKANPLNAVFILDVLKAVEAAGRDQAKLANVSLGTMFKKKHQLSAKKMSLTEDLFAEFARFKIGQTIAQKAPGTLLIIATGNDGDWADGVSKTVFPVGITSIRMMRVAQEKGLPGTPNNLIRNSLAVGSVNPNGTLTTFTNILIDPNIQQVFSTGEEIMSTVPGKKTNRAELNAGQVLSAFTVSGLKIKIHDMNNENRDLNTLLENERASNEAEAVEKGILKGLTNLIHIKNPVNHESMSGTSMATPTVTGLLARYVAEKMKREGISTADSYNHPALQPEQLIKDVTALAKDNKLSPMITIKMLIDGIKKWETSKASARQIRDAKAWVSAAKTCEQGFL